jgi:hypothetical protein
MSISLNRQNFNIKILDKWKIKAKGGGEESKKSLSPRTCQLFRPKEYRLSNEIDRLMKQGTAVAPFTDPSLWPSP